MNTLMHNPRMGKPEVIFVTYDEVIKSPYPVLLHQILYRFRSVYEKFLNFDDIDGMDVKALMLYCTKRTHKNVFRDLMITEFDIDKSLKEATDRFFDVYSKSDLLSIGDSLRRVAAQRFTKKIYIYTPVYDLRVHIDIQETYGDMDKINYVNGDFTEVIKNLPEITSYFLNDAEYVNALIEMKKLKHTTVLLAEYGFNYIKEGDELFYKFDVESATEEHKFKFGSFAPFIVTDDHLKHYARG